jgi:hypothetical protein
MDEADAYYLADGSTYEGSVFVDDKGVTFGEVTLDCAKCQGSGKWRRGMTCNACGGERTVFDQQRLYTAAQLAQRRKEQERRRDKKQGAERDRQEAIRIRREEFESEHGDLFQRARSHTDIRYVEDVLGKLAETGFLSQGQVDALRSIVDEREAMRRLYASSRPIGQAGDRVEVEVTGHRLHSFTHQSRFSGQEERVFVSEMTDREGNALFAMSSTFTLEPGATAVIRGTVKETDDRHGWVRTQLSRPMLVSPATTPDAPEPEDNESPFAP